MAANGAVESDALLAADGTKPTSLAGGLILPITFVMSLDRTAMTVLAPGAAERCCGAGFSVTGSQSRSGSRSLLLPLIPVDPLAAEFVRETLVPDGDLASGRKV